MSSSYSTSLKIQLMGNGDQSGTWGTTTNTNWNLMEQAVTGVASIVMANSNYTLSNLNGVSDEARCAVLAVTGVNSAIYQIVAPLVNKVYLVSNNTTGGYSITIGGATGTTVTIPNGVTSTVYCDGVNFYQGTTGTSGSFSVTGALTVNSTAQIDGTLTGAAANFSGAVTVLTPTYPNNTTRAASTAYVTTAIAALGSMSLQNSGAVTITGGTITGDYGLRAAGLKTTNWTVIESGGYLYFQYGGVNKMRLDSSGNLISTGNITAYGSI